MKETFTIKGVAVEPPERGGVQHKVVNGVRMLDLKGGIVQLKVVLPTEIPFHSQPIGVEPDEYVLVAAMAFSSQKWPSEVFTYDDKKFIIVPYESVLGVCREATTNAAG